MVPLSFAQGGESLTNDDIVKLVRSQLFAKIIKELNVTIVDDPSLADTMLTVGYTFAWDYPFSLTHQNTQVVLVSGKGTGPFSPPAGAASVAKELTKLLRPYRLPPSVSATKK